MYLENLNIDMLFNKLILSVLHHNSVVLKFSNTNF